MIMKRMVLAGLMAATALGATAPAFAQQDNNGGWRDRGRGNGGEMRQQRMEQRQQMRQARPEARQEMRQDRQQARQDMRQARPDISPDARQQVRRPAIAQQQATPAQRRDWREDRRDIREDRRDVREDRRDVRNGDNGWRDRAEDRRDVREDRRDVREDVREARRDSGNDWRNDNRGYANGNWNNGNRGNGNRGNGNWGNDGRRFDNRVRLDNRTRWSNQRRWDNGWRNDRRYDWQSYRRNYGQIYRPGRYYAPRGWGYGYQRFSVGIFLNGLLYSNNYWLDDPYRYRLPPAYGSLRWIRYYDDALLVDTRDGYVVDVINGFFY